MPMLLGQLVLLSVYNGDNNMFFFNNKKKQLDWKMWRQNTQEKGKIFYVPNMWDQYLIDMCVQ